MCKNKKLYRYMSFVEFVDILVNKRLTLKSPGNWEDKLENIFLKTVASEEGCTKLIELLNKKRSSEGNDNLVTDLQVITSKLLEVRCQCWTRNKDDLRMWQDRHSNKVVCVEVNEDSLKNNHLKYSNIRYKDEISVINEFESFEDENRWLIEFVLSKKKCFSYENECRIYKGPTSSNVIGKFHWEGTDAERVWINYLYAVEKNKTEPIYVPFDVQDIISVQSHPSATDYFEKIVKKLCEEYLSIDRYIGRSKILD